MRFGQEQSCPKFLHFVCRQIFFSQSVALHKKIKIPIFKLSTRKNLRRIILSEIISDCKIGQQNRTCKQVLGLDRVGVAVEGADLNVVRAAPGIQDATGK